MSELTFLPWLRRGLSASITKTDMGATAVARTVKLRAEIDVDTETASIELELRPADHAQAIEPGQIVRRYPGPSVDDAQHDYVPLIEFSAPDLPWLLTPLAAGDTAANGSRLRPWLALVCVPEIDADYSLGSTGAPATLEAPVAALPDLSDVAYFAHVQSAAIADDVVASLVTPGAVIARILCPVDLAPNVSYRAALVAAFRVDGDELVPTWDQGNPEAIATLAVYDSWTFRTGEVASFVDLAQRLGPIDPALDLDLGIHTVDVTDLGGIDPWPDAKSVNVDYLGALTDTDVSPAGLGPLKSRYDAELVDLLDQSDHRVDIKVDDPDPVVTPPLNGSYATDTHKVPGSGWLRGLNLTARNRMAAGLGAQVVQTHQERYMADAWEQAGEVLELRRALNASRLQAEIARTWKSRTDSLDPDQHATILRNQYTSVRTPGGQGLRAATNTSGIPNGLLTPAMARAARPGGIVDGVLRRRNDELSEGGEEKAPGPWGRSVSRQFGSPQTRRRIRLGAVDTPVGAVLEEFRHLTVRELQERGLSPTVGTSASRFGPEAPDTLALGAIASQARAGMRPMTAGRSRLEARVGGLAEFLAASGWPGDEIPTKVKIGPTIDEALMWALMEFSPELLMPGVGEFPNNAVRLVDANSQFVAAFLVGANHEMSRELLWREYPADVGSTTFARFWNRARANAVDIEPIASWGPKDSLATHGSSGGAETLVIVVRGDLLRHYPNVNVVLRDNTKELSYLSAFAGPVPPDKRFFGFDLTPDEYASVFKDDWDVVFQEQPAEPRFAPIATGANQNSATFAADAFRPAIDYAIPLLVLVGEEDL